MLKVNISNTWKNIKYGYVNVNNVWKKMKNIYTNVNGVWKPLWSYSWYAGNWSDCSAECGGGTQTRTVYCKRNDNVQVDDAFCSGTKPISSQSCNTQSCDPYIGEIGGEFVWNNNNSTYKILQKDNTWTSEKTHPDFDRNNDGFIVPVIKKKIYVARNNQQSSDRRYRSISISKDGINWSSYSSAGITTSNETDKHGMTVVKDIIVPFGLRALIYSQDGMTWKTISSTSKGVTDCVWLNGVYYFLCGGYGIFSTEYADKNIYYTTNLSTVNTISIPISENTILSMYATSNCVYILDLIYYNVYKIENFVCTKIASLDNSWSSNLMPYHTVLGEYSLSILPESIRYTKDFSTINTITNPFGISWYLCKVASNEDKTKVFVALYYDSTTPVGCFVTSDIIHWTKLTNPF